MDDQGKDQKNHCQQDSLPLFSLGTNITAGMIGCIFLGYYVGKRTGKEYWIFVGMGMGFIYSGYEIWKAIVFLQGDKNNRR